MALRRNALLLAVLTCLLAIIEAWGGTESLPGGWWRLPLGLLLLGLAYERWLVRRVGLQAQLHAAACLLGKRNTLVLRLWHASHRPIRVELVLDSPEAVEVENRFRALHVDCGAGRSDTLTVVARRLGAYPWPVLRLRMAGAFGLAWWLQPLRVEFILRVVPDLLDDATRRLGAVDGGARAAATMGMGSEVLQLREYRSGDAQHRIDWKATARRGQLVSRDFSEDQHLEIVVAIDAGRTSGVKAAHLDRLGQYANLAARFAENAVLHDDRVGLLIFADRPLAACAPARGLNAVLRIRHVLSTLQVAAAESNPLNAVLRIRSLVRHRSLVIMLTDLDDGSVASQLATAVRMLLPKHLPLIVGLTSPEVEHLAQAPASTWLAPFEALAAQEYCARLQSNVRALRALGAPAIMAQPEQLESAVFAAYAEFRRRRRV